MVTKEGAASSSFSTAKPSLTRNYIFLYSKYHNNIKRREELAFEVIVRMSRHFQLTGIRSGLETPPIPCLLINKTSSTNPTPPSASVHLLLLLLHTLPGPWSSLSDPETWATAAASYKHTESLFTSKPVVYPEALTSPCNITVNTLSL